METARRAVIDVGTNSVKLLVADVTGQEVLPVLEESRQTRLGRGFYESRRLRSGPIADTASAVAEFAAKAREQQATAIRVIATSAARDALNGQELASAIEQASGLKVEIISGDQEADLVFRGVTSNPEFASKPLLIVDVGGGSTELILGQGQQKEFQQSVPLGTVRLLEQIPHSEPPKPGELAACREWVAGFLQKDLLLCQVSSVKCQVSSATYQVSGVRCRVPAGVQLVGTGGTASILGCMEAQLEKFDRERLEATRLSRERVRWHVNRLWSLALEARRQVIGLPKNRADVILTGVVIYEALMEACGFAEVRISTRGLRFAAVIETR